LRLPLIGMNRRGITLIELIIAIVILGIVSIGFASIELFARYQTISSDRRSQILNEAAIAVESIAQKVRYSEGCIKERPFVVDGDGKGINIRKGDSAPGVAEPEPTSINPEMCRFEFEDNVLYYKDSLDAATREAIARKIIDFSLVEIDPEDADNPHPERPYALKIRVKTVYNPDEEISYPDNPDAAIETTVSCPSASAG